MIEHLTMMMIGIGHTSFLALAINILHGMDCKCRGVNATARSVVLVFAVVPVVAYFWVATLPWLEWPEPIRDYAVVCLMMSLVVIPFTTLHSEVRKRPGGVSRQAAVIDIADTAGAESLIGDGGGAWLLRLPGNESLRIHCEDWFVELPGLPRSLDGLSLVQLTDFHFSRCYRRQFFESVAAIAGRWEADLIRFTGDLVDHDNCLTWIEPVFSQVQGRLGKFAVLGNHDFRHDADAIRRELKRGGFADVDGRWLRLEVDGAAIAVGGSSAPWGPRLDPTTMPLSEFRLFLSHSPDLLYQASSWGIDLMVAGHNHGGQIRLPLLGPILMPSRYSRRFDQGFFRHGRTLLYVGRGVGGQQPIRYGCPPEITRFILRPANRPTVVAGWSQRSWGISRPLHAVGQVPSLSRADYHE